MDECRKPSHEEIALAAYYLWQSDMHFAPERVQDPEFYWFEAERDIEHWINAAGDV